MKTWSLFVALAAVGGFTWLLWLLLQGLNWISQLILDWLFDSIKSENRWTIENRSARRTDRC